MRVVLMKGLQFCSMKSAALLKAESYVVESLKTRHYPQYMLASYYPPQLRVHYCALQLFSQEVLKISLNSRQPALALGKIQFWRSSIRKIYASESPPPEPILLCLQDACSKHPLTLGYFDRILNAYAKDATIRSFNNLNEMTESAEEQQGPMLALFLQLMHIEIDSEPLRKTIQLLSRSVSLVLKQIGLCQYLRRIPYNLRQNKFMLPQDLLNKHNLHIGKIWERIYGKPRQELFDVVLQIAAFAKHSFEHAEESFREVKHPQSFRAFLAGVQTQLYLENLEKYNFDLFQAGLNRYQPLKLPYRTMKAAKAARFSV